MSNYKEGKKGYSEARLWDSLSPFNLRGKLMENGSN